MDAESMKVGRNEPCPCGSGSKYKKCHGRSVTPRRTPPPDDYTNPIDTTPGETAQSLKAHVEKTIKHVFDGGAGFHFGCGRGELCANVALLTVWLLEQFGVRARFAVGSARWDGYPHGYEWKGEREYHAWAVTEFDEIVDLACDAMSSRSDLSYYGSLIPSPRNCWTKRSALRDRDYREVPGGARELDVDCPGSETFDTLAAAALAFAKALEQADRLPDTPSSQDHSGLSG